MKQARLSSLIPGGPFQAHPVQIQAVYRRGMPGFQISGYNGPRMRELADRIRLSLLASGYEFPLGHVQVHFSPNDLPKTGAFLDLAMAVVLLRCFADCCYEQPLLQTEGTLFAAELTLAGELLGIPDCLTLCRQAKKHGFDRVVLAMSDLPKAALVPEIEIYGIATLAQLSQDIQSLEPYRPGRRMVQGQRPDLPLAPQKLDARSARALAASASGWHSLLLFGPPGSGKSTLARLLPALLAPPNDHEILDILTVQPELFTKHDHATLQIARPFRQPHHSITRRSLIGGGTPLGPGELSRAHHGLLLLDELAEFQRGTLQSLREPLMDHCVHLARGSQSDSLPSRFLLAATTNPCPCGYIGSDEHHCQCPVPQVRNYATRLLGPLRDRIEIELFCGNPDPGNDEPATTANELLRLVQAAQERQRRRYRHLRWDFNGQVPLEALEEFCPLQDSASQDFFNEYIEEKRPSQRALIALRRLARSLADLDQSTEIRINDLVEAANWRVLDTFYLNLGIH
ncbi:MAG: ATP-binding protein [Leptospiraceae bacterium]|nr:ATP-binding protein [Leptospiraceae bacterium]